MPEFRAILTRMRSPFESQEKSVVDSRTCRTRSRAFSCSPRGIHALLTLGDRRGLETYRHFIDSRPGHEQSMLERVSRVPEEIAGLPGVGFIKRPGRCDGPEGGLLTLSLPATLFIMARSNRSVYIRNKSPLLSLISIERPLQIIFAGKKR